MADRTNRFVRDTGPRQPFDPYAWIAARNAILDPSKGMEWRVIGEGEKAELKYGLVRRWQNVDPPCTPQEAAEILRDYARKGHAFAQRWATDMGITL